MFKQDNPKRKNSNTYKRYDVYKSAKDETEYFAIWNKSKKDKVDGFKCTTNAKADLSYDMKKGYVVLDENNVVLDENNVVLDENNNRNFIDLFAGTGAFSYALEKNGFKCVFANDMIKESKDIYSLNNDGNCFKIEDLNKVDTSEIPKHNILCGGFPCQPFSIAGDKKGFDDYRSNVFWKIIDILKFHKPNIIILENVKNLISHDKGNTFKIIEKNLIDIGYKLKYKILDTCKITNIPQHRERIYIVGFLNEEMYNNFDLEFNNIEKNKICDLLENEEEVSKNCYYTDKLQIYDKVRDGIKKNIYQHNTIYQYRRYYVRENMSNCCPTLTANMGSGGHNVPLLLDNKGIRRLTIRECFNLQGFPKNYKLPNSSNSSLYKLAGNAVSLPVINLIVEKLNKLI